MPSPLVPAQALWPEGYPYSWVSVLSSSLLSVPGEGASERGTEIWGHQYHLGPQEGPVGKVRSSQVLEAIRSYLGAHLHVKGEAVLSLFQ